MTPAVSGKRKKVGEQGALLVFTGGSGGFVGSAKAATVWMRWAAKAVDRAAWTAREGGGRREAADRGQL